jgi:hypothetical protein
MGFNAQPDGACSDGINVWIILRGTDRLARFSGYSTLGMSEPFRSRQVSN